MVLDVSSYLGCNIDIAVLIYDDIQDKRLWVAHTSRHWVAGTCTRLKDVKIFLERKEGWHLCRDGHITKILWQSGVPRQVW